MMIDDLNTGIGLLDQAIKLHAGHIDGSIVPNVASMKLEMSLMTRAHDTLTSLASDMGNMASLSLERLELRVKRIGA